MSHPPKSTPLLGWDLAAWRLAEADSSLRSTVVGILEISGSVDVASLFRRIQRAVDSEEVLRSRVISGPTGPALQEMPNFNINSVVEVLPTDSNIHEVALKQALEDFSADLPLWRLVLIPAPARTFVIASLHHAISDGNGALILAGHLFDESLLNTPSDNPHEPVDHEDSPSNSTPLQQAIVRTLDRAIRDPQGLARDISTLLKSVSSLVQVPLSTHASEMAARSNAFGYTLFQIPKREVRAAIVGQGVSQHDALVATVARALYLYQAESGQPLERIRVNVPVALDASAVAANKLVVARLEIEVDDAPIGLLMKRSNEALRKWRQEPALLIAQELVEASRLVPARILATAIKKADATISTMRGMPRLGHVFGAEITAIWPLVAPVGAAVSVTSMGIGSDIAMCVSRDLAAVSNGELWERCLSQAMSEAAGISLKPIIF